MKQVYPRLKRSRPFPFPLEDCSFPRSGLSDLATLGLTTVRSRKRKVLSRKRKLGLDLFLSGIYLFPALQNIYSLGVGLLRFGSFFAMARADFVVQLHLDLDTYNDLDTASTFRGHWPWKVLSAASGHGKSLSLRYHKP